METTSGVPPGIDGNPGLHGKGMPYLGCRGACGGDSRGFCLEKVTFFWGHFGSWGDVLVFENLMDPIGLTMIRLIERNLEPVDTSR